MTICLASVPFVNLTEILLLPPLRGGKKSAQGREFKVYKEREGKKREEKGEKKKIKRKKRKKKRKKKKNKRKRGGKGK